ncbi:hypothetical protein HYZ78_03685 [Candidatus Microgenomates bacterium]|nr:hypothetical protein [Candidatus Microgenomates bacterium]
MSDLEDTNEGQQEQTPRPLPEILGPVSREERGRLFGGFARQIAIENGWVKNPEEDDVDYLIDEGRWFAHHGCWSDKERLLLVGGMSYLLVRSTEFIIHSNYRTIL